MKHRCQSMEFWNSWNFDTIKAKDITPHAVNLKQWMNGTMKHRCQSMEFWNSWNFDTIKAKDITPHAVNLKQWMIGTMKHWHQSMGFWNSWSFDTCQCEQRITENKGKYQDTVFICNYSLTCKKDMKLSLDDWKEWNLWHTHWCCLVRSSCHDNFTVIWPWVTLVSFYCSGVWLLDKRKECSTG